MLDDAVSKIFSWYVILQRYFLSNLHNNLVYPLASLVWFNYTKTNCYYLAWQVTFPYKEHNTSSNGDEILKGFVQLKLR